MSGAYYGQVTVHSDYDPIGTGSRPMRILLLARRVSKTPDAGSYPRTAIHALRQRNVTTPAVQTPVVVPLASKVPMELVVR